MSTKAVDKEIIRNFLIGGASLGGGAALVTSLLNYLKRMDDRRKETEDDDDVLYVYKDDNAPIKSASGEDKKEKGWTALGTGVAGGAAAALATYALVRKLYTEFMKREAQKELDEAQHIFVGSHGYKDAKQPSVKRSISLDESDPLKQIEVTGKGELVEKPDVEVAAEKVAAASDRRGMTTMEYMEAAPVALPLLLALASGVVTNEVLKSKFGTPKPKIKPPKRIEVVEKPADDQDEYTKAAYYPEDMVDDASEFLLRMTLANPCENSDLTNLVKAAAMGGQRAIKDTVMIIGFEKAMGMVKGASAQMPDPLAEHLAVCYLNKSARLKYGTRLLAAGEFVEQYPELYKEAVALPAVKRDALFKIAGILGIALRAERSQELGVKAEGFNVKQAAKAAPGQEEDILSALIDEVNRRRGETEEENQNEGMDNEAPTTEGDEYESSDTSGQEAGISDPDSPSRPDAGQKLNFIRSGKTTRRYQKGQDNDIIDELLSSK